MSAFTPKTTTLDLVAQTKRDRQENRAHTSTQRSHPYIHVYATSLRRHRLKSEQPGTEERREERQHNSSSATTNTDGHPDQSFPLLPCQKCPTDCNHLVNKFVCKQGQTPKPLTPNSFLTESVSVGQNTAYIKSATSQTSNQPGHLQTRQIT